MLAPVYRGYITLTPRSFTGLSSISDSESSTSIWKTWPLDVTACLYFLLGFHWESSQWQSSSQWPDELKGQGKSRRFSSLWSSLDAKQSGKGKSRSSSSWYLLIFDAKQWPGEPIGKSKSSSTWDSKVFSQGS